MSKKFVRRDTKRYSKLGKNRKKIQRWRSVTGRDNKIRLNKAGYPTKVKVGFKSSKKESGKISGLTPILVRNTKDLETLDKKSAVIIAKVGAKKKLDIIKKAIEMKLKILNLAKEVAK